MIKTTRRENPLIRINRCCSVARNWNRGTQMSESRRHSEECSDSMVRATAGRNWFCLAQVFGWDKVAILHSIFMIVLYKSLLECRWLPPMWACTLAVLLHKMNARRGRKWWPNSYLWINRVEINLPWSPCRTAFFSTFLPFWSKFQFSRAPVCMCRLAISRFYPKDPVFMSIISAFVAFVYLMSSVHGPLKW